MWPQRVSYWPRRQSPCIREVNFAIAEKMSIFQEQGSQGIAEKYARDCRNFVKGRGNTRSLGAQSLHEILKWKGKSYLNENKSYRLPSDLELKLSTCQFANDQFTNFEVDSPTSNVIARWLIDCRCPSGFRPPGSNPRADMDPLVHIR